MLAKRIALPTPESDSFDPINPDPVNPINPRMNELPQPPAASTAVAPAWHTIVLVAGILALSIHSASSFSAAHGPINRLRSYGFTAAMEAGIFAWAVVGLRLKKISLRSLLGSCPLNFRSIARDLGCALIFWITSLMVLGSLGIAWSGVEAALTHRLPLTRALWNSVVMKSSPIKPRLPSQRKFPIKPEGSQCARPTRENPCRNTGRRQ